jgi:hypothetical protein
MKKVIALLDNTEPYLEEMTTTHNYTNKAFALSGMHSDFFLGAGAKLTMMRDSLTNEIAKLSSYEPLDDNTHKRADKALDNLNYALHLAQNNYYFLESATVYDVSNNLFTRLVDREVLRITEALKQIAERKAGNLKLFNSNTSTSNECDASDSDQEDIPEVRCSIQ